MEQENLDFITNLPYEILHQIISLVPLKEAIRTSILSTSWRSLWTPKNTILEFDNSDQITSQEAIEKLVQTVAMLSKSSYSPELWKIYVRSPEKGEDLIFLAARGTENEIHFDFSRENELEMNFNLSFEPGLSSSCKDSSRFSSIKSLNLRSLNNLTKIMVSSLFTNCLFLESLKLEKCGGLESIDIKGNNHLQRLRILDCPNIVSINICAPNLKSFLYRGVLSQIEMKSCPNLVDVVLDFGEGLGVKEFDCEDIVTLLASLKDIEILTISGWLLEWLCTAGVIFGRLEFKLNKLKELHWIGSSIERTKRDSLICFLNTSPFLEKMFIKIDKSCPSIPCPIFHQYWHEPHLWMDYETVTHNGSQLEHLKLVKLVGFTEEKDQLLLMDLLIKKAITLKDMIVISADNKSWCVSKIPQSQKNLISRCYSKCLGLSYPNKKCYFGLTEENKILFL